MNNTRTDVFFIHPLVLQNLGSYNTVDNVLIVNQNAILIQASIRGQVGLLAKYRRMFAPSYRQAVPPSFINSSLDIKQANTMSIANSAVMTLL
jgi:hypothetical protein